jgi:hypothetical protein
MMLARPPADMPDIIIWVASKNLNFSDKKLKRAMVLLLPLK